jgi:hypothetical protein
MVSLPIDTYEQSHDKSIFTIMKIDKNISLLTFILCVDIDFFMCALNIIFLKKY